MSCKKFCERKQLYSPWNSPGQNNGVGSLSLLQGLFPTQGSNPGLPHCRQILYQLSHKGSLRILEWVKWSEVKSLSRVRFFATPWTVAHQAPPFMGFSRQEYWSGVPLPSPKIWLGQRKWGSIKYLVFVEDRNQSIRSYVNKSYIDIWGIKLFGQVILEQITGDLRRAKDAWNIFGW